jgi:hypothetical protein
MTTAMGRDELRRGEEEASPRGFCATAKEGGAAPWEADLVDDEVDLVGDG